MSWLLVALILVVGCDAWTGTLRPAVRRTPCRTTTIERPFAALYAADGDDNKNQSSLSATDKSGSSSPTNTSPPPPRRRQLRDASSRRPPPLASRRDRTPRRAETSFDGKALVAAQQANEDAPSLDLQALLSQDESPLRCMTDGISFPDNDESSSATPQPSWEFYSLDDVTKVAGLSEQFNSDAAFRENLRMAIRRDIFDTTPFYAKLSAKAAQVLLSPDSSLEGSWRKPPTMADDDDVRMVQTTQVLRDALGSDGVTGDQLMAALGALCGPDASTHFIDIYGVQDRRINHSWHRDAGMASAQSRTVLWGFPRENQYEGCGVFSHFVPLQKPCAAPVHHPRMEPLLFAGTLPDDTHIVRPWYAPGREIMVFCDVDSLHSAPDVTYRASLMRFM